MMETTIILAWHSTEPLTLAEVENRLARVTNLSNQQTRKRILSTSESGHTGMALWVPKTPICNTLIVHEDGLCVFTNPPFGLTRLVDRVQPSNLPNMLHDFVTRLRRDPTNMSKVSPPTAVVHLNSARELFLMNDIRGLAEI